MLFCAMLCALVGSPQALTSFETEADLNAVDHLGTTIERFHGHATDGLYSLRAVFHSVEWPHIMWTPPHPLDWRTFGGLEVDVFNPNDKAIELGIRVDDDPSANGWNHSRSSTTTLAPHSTQSVAISLGLDPMKFGMRALPPMSDGRQVTSSGDENFSNGNVVAYQFFVHKPEEGTVLYFDNVRTFARPNADSLTGIVDRYGQFAHATWPGKLTHDFEFAARTKSEKMDLDRTPSLPGRDAYGGWLAGPALHPTGFFRTEKVQGKWWLVDPAGHLFFSIGIDTIQPYDKTMIAGREKLFSWMPEANDPLARFQSTETGVLRGPVKEGKAYAFYQANLYRRYGPGFLEPWREIVLKRLPSWGFNTIANWSDATLYGNGKVPYVASSGTWGSHATVSSGSDFWGRMPDPFDPAFAADATRTIKPIADKVKSDRWCLGYFIDNELSWAGDGPDGPYGLAIGALSEPPTSPARQAFIDELQTRYSMISSLNLVWGTKAASWDELRLPSPLNDASRKDASIFVKEFARRYFRVIRDTIRKLDPNHLYLGCRFAWRTTEAEDAAAEFCDVVSFNIYSPKLDSNWDAVKRLNKPCIVGEFHFGALDRGMFHPGLVSTPNQAARAAMYQDYVRSVLKSPSFVGCHWFQYIDEPLTGRSFDGENYNIGFVTVTDTPYPEMVAAARKIHEAACRIRLGNQP